MSTARAAFIAVTLSLTLAAYAAAEDFTAAELAVHPKSSSLVLARSFEGGLRLVDFTDAAKPAARAIAVKAASAAFLPDGRIVTGGPDGMLRFWTTEGAEAGGAIRASTSPIGSLAVSAHYIAATDDKLVVRVFRPDGRPVGRALPMVRQRVDIPCTASAVAIAPGESMIAAMSCTGIVYAWSMAGQPVAVPRRGEGYEGCCGAQIGFSDDGRFLVARRSFQPGYDAFAWTRRAGALAGGQKFPGSEQLRVFAVLANTAEMLILDQTGLRRLSPAGGASGATLVPNEPNGTIRHFAASADGARIATIEGDGDIVYRAGDGAVLARFSLR